MGNGNLWILLFVACIIGIRYLRLPLQVKETVWIDPRPVPLEDPPTVEQGTEVSKFFEKVEQFELLGYRKEKLIVFSEITPNSIVFVQPFRNFEEVCVGSLVVTLQKEGDSWRVVDKRIGFQTSFSDESAIASGFSLTQEMLGPPEGHESFLVPWTQDVAQLNSIHQRLVGYFGRNQVKVDIVAENYNGDMTKALVERSWADWQRYSESKYFYLEKGHKHSVSDSTQTSTNPYAAPTVSPQSDRLLLNYRGAYLLTWGILFPFKQILRWNGGRKTKRVLRRC